MPRCAYCNSEETLTREHIIPKSIIKLFEQDRSRGVQFISSAGGKYIDGESTIRDVCARCNNETLGELDAYASRHFAPQCTDFLEEGETRKIDYNFILLARWLIKLAYNSARVSKIDEMLLRPYRGFVQGKAPAPKRLALFIAAIKPYDLTPQQRVRFVEKYGKFEDKFYPDLFRICQIMVPGDHGDVSVTRAFFLRSIAVFILVGPKKMSEQQFKQLVGEFNISYPQAKKINPLSKNIIVETGELNAWDVLEFHASAYPHIYGQDG